MFADLSGLEELPQPKIVDARIVGNRGEILHALADQGIDQVSRDAAQPEASDHHHCSVLHIADGLISAGNDFIHKQMILNTLNSGSQMRMKAWQNDNALIGKLHRYTSAAFRSPDHARSPGLPDLLFPRPQLGGAAAASLPASRPGRIRRSRAPPDRYRQTGCPRPGQTRALAPARGRDRHCSKPGSTETATVRAARAQSP